MAVMPRVLLVLIALLATDSEGSRMRANPIRRVITMLQMMMKKSEDQATSEEQLFDKFMCSCKKTQEALMGSIKTGTEKVPQLEASVEELNARIATASSDFTQAKKDRADAEKSIQEATTMRTGEAKEYAKDSTEAKANIKAMTGAVTALKSGISQEDFLQTNAAPMIQGLLATGKPGKDYDRQALGAFLQEGDSTEETPEIIGILEQMKEDMQADLKAMEKAEVTALANYEALSAAKSKQITAASMAIQELGSRIAGGKVEVVNTKTDLKDTNERLESDQGSYGESKLTCQKRDQEYGILKKQFADEKVALADTIKILADDQAMEVFKKTNPTSKGAAATFLQVGSSSRHRQRQALKVLQDASAQHPDQPGLALLTKRVAAAARKSGGHSKKGFEKIMGLIDKMIALLGKEANDDKIKKEMCEVDLSRNADKKAQLENGIKSTSAEVANLKDNLGIVKKDMAQIKADMTELDKQVKEATSQRQQENAAFTQMLSETNQAVGILEVAKSRLKEFYGLQMSKSASFVQQQQKNTEDEAFSFIQEGESDGESSEEGASTSSADEYSDTQKAALIETAVVHKKKPQAQGAKAVITMVKTIQQDLQAEFKTAKVEETEAQADYEGLLADAKKKREVTARAMTEKEGAKAALQETSKKKMDRIGGLDTELKETVDIEEDLHKNCDWLQTNFQERVKLRAAEVEALRRAKSTLAGAD